MFVELNRQQGALRSLVQELRGGLSQVDTLMPKVDTAVVSTTRLVAGTTESSQSISRMIGIMDEFSKPQPGVPPTDWGLYVRLAERVENAAKEINALLLNLQKPGATASGKTTLLQYLVLTQLVLIVLGCALLLVTLLVYHRIKERSRQRSVPEHQHQPSS